MSDPKKPDIMHRIAAGIIRSRSLILILFIAAGIYCALSVGKVRVSSDLTAFLPADMDPDDEDYGIVLLKQVPGTEELENLEDDEEEDIYNRFMERLFSEDDEG